MDMLCQPFKTILKYCNTLESCGERIDDSQLLQYMRNVFLI